MSHQCFIGCNQYLQTTTSVPLLEIISGRGMSTLILQRYHPVFVILTFDKMYVLFMFIQSSVEFRSRIIFSDILFELLKGPELLKCQVIRYLSYPMVLRQQCNSNVEPAGTLTSCCVLFRIIEVWPDVAMAVAATVITKKHYSSSVKTAKRAVRSGLFYL